MSVKRPQRCNAAAYDRTSHRNVFCTEKHGHQEPHIWRQIKGDRFLSATWYGNGVSIGPYDPDREEPT